jgi:hypothetical protein
MIIHPDKKFPAVVDNENMTDMFLIAAYIVQYFDLITKFTLLLVASVKRMDRERCQLYNILKCFLNVSIVQRNK